MSIKIKKTGYISGTLTDEVHKEITYSGTYIHIKDVQKGCAFIANKIIEAGINHDDTKMTIDNVNFAIEEGKTGISVKDGEWYKSHIENNRHHFYQHDNLDDCNLIDVIEAIVDCVMAAKARRGQSVKMSTDFISPELLAKAFKNTVEMLENEIIVEDE